MCVYVKATVQLVCRGNDNKERTIKSSACLSFFLCSIAALSSHYCFLLKAKGIALSTQHTHTNIGETNGISMKSCMKEYQRWRKRKYRPENAFNSLTPGPRASSLPLSLEGRRVGGEGGLHTGVSTAKSVPSGQLFMCKQCRGAFCGWRSTG